MRDHSYKDAGLRANHGNWFVVTHRPWPVNLVVLRRPTNFFSNFLMQKKKSSPITLAPYNNHPHTNYPVVPSLHSEHRPRPRPGQTKSCRWERGRPTYCTWWHYQILLTSNHDSRETGRVSETVQVLGNSESYTCTRTHKMHAYTQACQACMWKSCTVIAIHNLIL